MLCVVSPQPVGSMLADKQAGADPVLRRDFRRASANTLSCFPAMQHPKNRDEAAEQITELHTSISRAYSDIYLFIVFLKECLTDFMLTSKNKGKDYDLIQNLTNK